MLYLPQIWVEARGNELHDLLVLLLKYADGFDSTCRGNIDKHCGSVEQHDSSL